MNYLLNMNTITHTFLSVGKNTLYSAINHYSSKSNEPLEKDTAVNIISWLKMLRVNVYYYLLNKLKYNQSLTSFCSGREINLPVKNLPL